MRDTAKTVVAASLLAGVLSCCAGQESTPAGPLSEAAVDMAVHSGDYPDQLWRVTVVEGKLMERCMRAAGFSWTSETPPPARRGGAEALAEAQRNGYGMSEPDQAPTSADEKRAARARDPRFRTAMLGPEDDLAELTVDGLAAYTFPRTGCAAQAHTAVYGTLDTWARISYIPQELNLTISDQARSDHRYHSALQRWRDCMAMHHYTYGSPTEIIEELGERYRGSQEPLAQRRAGEIVIAVRDVTCDQQAGLTSTLDVLRREYAQRLSAPQRAELTWLAHLFDQVRQRAPALVS